MNFAFDETQDALQGLARQIFSDLSTHEHLKELGDDQWDDRLWVELGKAGLLELDGFIEQCIVLVEQGRTTARVPLWSHLLGRALVGDDAGIVTVALDEPGADDATAMSARAKRGRVTGVKVGVAAENATTMVVSASGELWKVAASDVELRTVDTTSGVNESIVLLDRTPAERVEADPYEAARRAVVMTCALQVGVCERALELTASYVSERKQFDQPLGKFQAVQQRAADAYIDVEAMRWTMWQAAWRMATGRPLTDEVEVAKFWAAEGGQRVVSTAQHLHGGMGSDIDYPLYRHTLWAKQLELSFGGATRQLVKIGKELAR